MAQFFALNPALDIEAKTSLSPAHRIKKGKV